MKMAQAMSQFDMSKLAPGIWCFSHFSLYSKYFTPKKAQPKTVVSTSLIDRVARRAPVAVQIQGGPVGR